MRLKKKHKRWIMLGIIALAIGGIIFLIVNSSGDEKPKEKENVIISAGDDGKDNEADFNAQEHAVTEPVKEEVVENNVNNVEENANSVVGEWATAMGDTFICYPDGETFTGEISLVDSGKYSSGTIETDHKTYIKIKGESLIDLTIENIAAVTDAEGNPTGTITLMLIDNDNSNRYIMSQMSIDNIDEEVAEIIKQNPDGVEEELFEIATDAEGNIKIEGEDAEILEEYIEIITEPSTEPNSETTQTTT